MTTIPITTLTLLLAWGLSAFAADERDYGVSYEVGKITIGGIVVEGEMAGLATPGKEVKVELHITPAAPAPKAVRVWIGSESGRGSAKTRAAGEVGHASGYEALVVVPSPLPDGSRIWISLEPAQGDTVTGSLALPGPNSKVHEHDHDHEGKK